MIIDIFIRSYPKDFTLLHYCLLSIKKFVTGYRDIILCIREKDYIKLTRSIDLHYFKVKIVKEYNFKNNVDYVGQQISKLKADIYSNAEYFCYVDSDCIFTRDVDITKIYFNSQNKIIIVKEKWCNCGEAIKWKKGLDYLKLTTEYEFMRILPQIYPSLILPKIRELIMTKNIKDLNTTIIFIHNKMNFSEFNIMGAYLYLNHFDNCIFLNAEEYKNPNISKQFFSHSDLNIIIPKIKRIINS